MRTRPAARMLIINPEDRLLLFRTESSPMDPARPISAYWYVPGGGVEDGEGFEEAAHRELWEEVGIQDAELGPCVWVREQVLHFPGSGVALAHERFFPVRVEHSELSFENMIDYEATVLERHHWWSAGELRATTDVVFPEDLPTLMPAILAGDYPDEPLRIR